MVPARSMLLLALVALAAGEVRPPVELVLARADDVQDTALHWVKEFSPEVRVTLYSKGRQTAPGLSDVLTEVPLPNVGQEPHAFLHHIVKHYESLPEKTVFMPGAAPAQGFTGFHRGAASLLPGVTAKDYIASESPPLFVPTMAVTPDLKQVSVRMAFMENAQEKDLPQGRHFTTCSAVGKAGWSPLLPNKFGQTVLEPLMKAQEAKSDLKEFWAQHLSDVPMPELLMYAHGTAQSVSRAQVHSHPKVFYEKLLEEVSNNKNPYQMYFLEYMWYYIFHGKEAALCPNEMPLATVAAQSDGHRRQLQNADYAKGYVSSSGQISVLEPHAGDRLKFGDVATVSWTSTMNTMWRAELWRYGNFQTVLATLFSGNSFTWPVTPGPEELSVRRDDPSFRKPWASDQDGMVMQKPGPNINKPMYNTRYLLTPNDRYTIRICPASWNNANIRCTGIYSSSGEFDILASVDVTSPPQGFVIDASALDPSDPYNQFSIPVTWTSYYTDGSNMTVRVIDAVTGYTQMVQPVLDTGNYNLYIPPDMPSGQYFIQVTASCTDSRACPGNQWMSSSGGQSGSVATGKSGIFTVVGNSFSPPPPAPTSPPAPPSPPDNWEVPIIKAFQSQFGGGPVVQTVDGYSTSSTVAGTATSRGQDCEYVCRVRDVMGRRSLLFGGLQYSGGTQVVGCNRDQIDCHCPGC